MAILKSIVSVNNGNTGWTTSNVMDALETVFSNLGFHGGSAVTGVPQVLKSPTGVISADHESWRQAGGLGVFSNHKTYYYDVTAVGTTAYRWLRKTYVSSAYHFYSSTHGNSNQIYSQDHKLVQNQAIHWAPGETDENKNVNGLTLDTVYYVIVVDSNHFKLAASAADAANGTNVVLSNGGYLSNTYNSAAKSSAFSYFREENVSTYNNRTININMGDVLNINLISTGAGNFYFCYDTDSYDANNYVSAGLPEQNTGIATEPTGMGSDSGNVIWNTLGYLQTYTASTRTLFHPTETQESGRKYIYANDTNSNMKGTIIVNPSVHDRGNVSYPEPFWDYEVPQSGSRSALKIRVWRRQDSSTDYRGKIRGMIILNQGSGWTDNEVFTIPGTGQLGNTSISCTNTQTNKTALRQ